MKHAGQKDPSTYGKHYTPNNSGTDGQGSYFGTEVRSVVNDLFRGSTVARNPHLPERDRLAEGLFKTDTLRSPTGLQALRDMIALCEPNTEVNFRPGLEPNLCQCGKSTRRRKLPQSARAANDLQSIYDWKHTLSVLALIPVIQAYAAKGELKGIASQRDSHCVAPTRWRRKLPGA